MPEADVCLEEVEIAKKITTKDWYLLFALNCFFVALFLSMYSWMVSDYGLELGEKVFFSSLLSFMILGSVFVTPRPKKFEMFYFLLIGAAVLCMYFILRDIFPIPLNHVKSTQSEPQIFGSILSCAYVLTVSRIFIKTKISPLTFTSSDMILYVFFGLVFGLLVLSQNHDWMHGTGGVLSLLGFIFLWKHINTPVLQAKG